MGQHHIKLDTGLSVSRSIIFKMKQVLDDSSDLQLWRRGGMKQF
jgi:hypothetical protein